MSITFWIDGDPIIELGPDEGDGYGAWMGRQYETNFGAGNTGAVLRILGLPVDPDGYHAGSLDPEETWARFREVMPTIGEDHPHARRLVSLQEVVRQARVLGEPVLYG